MAIDEVLPAAPVGISCLSSMCRVFRRNSEKTCKRNPQLLLNATGETAASAARVHSGQGAAELEFISRCNCLARPAACFSH
ncbi:hypothetical protein [Bosea sp. TAF32]|uniref:hypothetical protein n=1 Tax=Bosea sp. TAF32 TaxID=3237482 RepID=UPI003F8F04F0